jgi:flagellar biogenesis protein FliO
MRTLRYLLFVLSLAPAAPAAAQFADLPPIDSIGQPATQAPSGTAPSSAAASAPAGRLGLMPFRSVGEADGNGETQSAAVPDASPLKLSPPRDRRSLDRPAPQTPAGALTTVLGSLAVVLGLFFVVVWFTRRALPRAATSLPAEAVEVLGRTPLSGRQNMHVIRFGPKLLLVSVTPTGAETLAEINDADQVERIAGICKQNQPGSVTATFRQVLSQFGSEPAPAGFLGTDPGGERAASAANRRQTPRQRADA